MAETLKIIENENEHTRYYASYGINRGRDKANPRRKQEIGNGK